MFFGPPAPVEAKKKKLLTAILLGALLGSKQKLMPLPLPLPVSELKTKQKFDQFFHVNFLNKIDSIANQT